MGLIPRFHTWQTLSPNTTPIEHATLDRCMACSDGIGILRTRMGGKVCDECWRKGRDGGLLIEGVSSTGRLAAVLRRIDVSGFPIPLRLYVVDRFGGDELICDMLVPDRNSGEPISIHTGLRVHPSADERDVLEQIKQAIHKAVTHELAEHFKVDGVRVHDPHAERKPE